MRQHRRSYCVFVNTTWTVTGPVTNFRGQENLELKVVILMLSSLNKGMVLTLILVPLWVHTKSSLDHRKEKQIPWQAISVVVF